VVAVTST